MRIRCSGRKHQETNRHNFYRQDPLPYLDSQFEPLHNNSGKPSAPGSRAEKSQPEPAAIPVRLPETMFSAYDDFPESLRLVLELPRRPLRPRRRVECAVSGLSNGLGAIVAVALRITGTGRNRPVALIVVTLHGATPTTGPAPPRAPSCRQGHHRVACTRTSDAKQQRSKLRLMSSWHRTGEHKRL